MANEENTEKTPSKSRAQGLAIIILICACATALMLRGCPQNEHLASEYQQKIDSLQSEIRIAETQKSDLDKKADSLSNQLITYRKETSALVIRSAELRTHRTSVTSIVKALPDSSLIGTFVSELNKFSQQRNLH